MGSMYHAGVASYPRCGADACNAPWPTSFSGSDQAAAIQFVVQMSANQGILPFDSSQKAAVTSATQALFTPLYGEYLLTCCVNVGCRAYLADAQTIPEPIEGRKVIVMHTCAGAKAAQITYVDVLSSGSTPAGTQAVTAKVCVSAGFFG